MLISLIIVEWSQLHRADVDIPYDKTSLPIGFFFPAGLAHQISATVDVLVGLGLILQCLPQAGLSSTAREVKWFNVT